MDIRSPIFQMYRGDTPVVEMALDAEELDDGELAIGETDRVSFEIAPTEPGLEYEILIGDFPTQSPFSRRGVFQWTDDAYFDSARGRTQLSVRSREIDASGEKWKLRCKCEVWISPNKLTEGAYQTMFDELARLSVGMVFDLLSKSVGGVGRFALSSPGAISIRSAQIELRILWDLWTKFSRALSDIIRQPETALRARSKLDACFGAEQFAPGEYAKIAARGIDPRSRHTPRPFTAEIAKIGHSYDIIEHRAIGAFLDLIYTRAHECASKARSEVHEIRRDKWFRNREVSNGKNLYEIVDSPRIAKLESAAEVALELASQIRMARGSMRLVSMPVGLSFLRSTPIFENVRHYRCAWGLMNEYMNTSAITVASGAKEKAKQTWRMYEQWVFLKLAAAFRKAGMQCRSQRDFLTALSASSFTVDLQRGASLIFVAPDEWRIVMRYEPWVFGRQVAAGRGEAVFQGKDEAVPWSPDVLIEFMKPVGQGTYTLEYAIVVDAKYVRNIRDSHWEQCRKYMQIRSVENGEAVVKQVWLAKPSAEGIKLEDPGLEWTVAGPTARSSETIMGQLGLLPERTSNGEYSMATETASKFIRGTLSYLGIEHCETQL